MADMKSAMIAYAMLDPRVSDLETKVDNITNPFEAIGRVDTVADLANVQNPEPGWVYLVGLESDPNKAEYWYTVAGTWEYLGQRVEIDAALSTTSENAVQNKVITLAINGKAALTIVAANFDATVTYSLGKIVIKDGALYIYSAQQASSGDWDASKWTAITIGDQLEAKANSADLATVATSGDYSDLSNKPTIPDAVTVTQTGDMYVGSVCVRKVLTQAEYDLLDPPDERCDYKIVPATT